MDLICECSVFSFTGDSPSLGILMLTNGKHSALSLKGFASGRTSWLFRHYRFGYEDSPTVYDTLGEKATISPKPGPSIIWKKSNAQLFEDLELCTGIESMITCFCKICSLRKAYSATG